MMYALRFLIYYSVTPSMPKLSFTYFPTKLTLPASSSQSSSQSLSSQSPQPPSCALSPLTRTLSLSPNKPQQPQQQSQQSQPQQRCITFTNDTASTLNFKLRLSAPFKLIGVGTTSQPNYQIHLEQLHACMYNSNNDNKSSALEELSGDRSSDDDEGKTIMMPLLKQESTSVFVRPHENVEVRVMYDHDQTERIRAMMMHNHTGTDDVMV